ncbi:MAG: hypothetical protein JWP58_1789 [Hymenobacter sp.]|nr:hypothetical protein [Hymenobacter sp.]
MSSLKGLIPDHLAYAISKLYEGYFSGYPMAEADLSYIADVQTKLKEGLTQKYSSYQDIDSVSATIETLDHIVQRLKHWLEEGELKGNMDAKIFIDALKWHYEALKGMLGELDASGWMPGDES